MVNTGAYYMKFSSYHGFFAAISYSLDLVWTFIESIV